MSRSSISANHAFRKLLLVGVLGAAIVTLHHFAVPTGSFDPSAMLALGFVILACFAIGELVELIRLPHISGYLLAGLLLGPSAAGLAGRWWDLGPLGGGVLSQSVISQLGLFEGLALALIALTAGGELKLDAMRQGLKTIAAVLAGQVMVILPVLALFVMGLALPIPFVGQPALSAWTWTQLLAVGLAVASIGVATSPAATIAVITSAGARGPFSRAVLSVVVLKDVVVVILFSVFLAIAVAALGQSGDSGLLKEISLHVLGSIAAGAAVGLLASLYLRYIRAEVLLFLVGLVFATSWVAEQLHLNLVLLFIAAGFTTANFSREGDTLIHMVERLSTPVYVVFFTLVGARLHLDHLAQMVVPALLLVVVRAGAIGIGVWGGARLAGAPLLLQRYGWMGFISQAGVAIGLAGILGERLGAQGAVLETLVVAAVAIHELIGPVLLKFALSLSREIPSEMQGPEESAPAEAAQRTFERWPKPERGPDPWGPPLQSKSLALVRIVHEVEGELQGLVRDLLQGPLEHFRASADGYLRSLRREFLHHHRRTLRELEAAADPAARVAVLQAALTRLADQWRVLVLQRAAETARNTGDLSGLIEALDQLVDSVPERIEVPYEDDAHRAQRGDGLWTRLGKGGLAVRVLGGHWSGHPPTHELLIRQLVAWYLFGKAPARLEGVAAILVSGDEHVLQRTRMLFDSISAAFQAALAAARAGEQDYQEPLVALRQEIDEAFTLASQEVEHIVRDGAIRAARILGEQSQGIKADAIRLGTPALSTFQRRISSVFAERTAGLAVLDGGLQGARQTTAAQWSVLALELELVALEGRIRDTVEEHAGYLGRMVRGRGHTQLSRVQLALDGLLKKADGLLAATAMGDGAARALRAEADAFERVMRESIRNARLLQVQLNAENTLSKMLDALLIEARGLTERYAIPKGGTLRGEWKLPPRVASEEISFRDAVVAFVESSMARSLLDITREYSGRIDKLIVTLEEVDRVITFNAELSSAELEVHEGEVVPPEVLHSAREMLLGPARRAANRLDELVSTSSAWSDALHAGLRDAVLHDLAQIRQRALDGRLGELRPRGRADGRPLLEDSLGAAGRAAAWLADLQASARRSLGDERIARVRQWVGLAQETRTLRFGPGAFDPPPSIEALPVVYRRLFSEHALDVSDLLIGRESELARARVVLTTERVGTLRAVAVVGEQGVGKGAVIGGLVRTIEATKVERVQFDKPVRTEQIAALFTGVAGRVVVLEGLQWLFTAAGAAPLQALVEGVVADRGRTRWILEAEVFQWRYACRLVALEDAFPEVIYLKPLGPAQLSAAVLAHHNLSGYVLRFQPETDIGWRIRHALSRAADKDLRRQEAWFSTLYSVTQGRIHDALRLWMASVEVVDEKAGVVQVGPVPQPPLAALASLPDEVMLTLRQTLRQGWISVELHSRLFREDRAASASHLARLAHWGLLVSRGDLYLLAANLNASVHRELRHRGWES